jgi:small neutral amino acid transporter SnatA (MarC family)
VRAAYVILVAFMLGGRTFLQWLHLSEQSLTIAGGIILFLIAIRMVFPRPEGVFGDRPARSHFSCRSPFRRSPGPRRSRR